MGLMRPGVVAAVVGLLAFGCGGPEVEVTVVGGPAATETPALEAATLGATPSATMDGVGAATLVGDETATPAASGRVTIAAVGDVMLARSLGRRILAGEGAAILADVATLLTGADIAVANLETAVSDIGAPQAKGYTFRSPPGAIDVLVGAGIDVAALANNHALDYGPEALLDTVARLSAAGIANAGAGANEAEARAPAVVERNGVRAAFLSYVDTQAEGSYSQGTWDAGPGTAGVAWASVGELQAVVAAAAMQADVVVVLLHFGIEYATVPSEAQRVYARAAIDAGALLVLGSHAHVLQPLEEYGGGLIAFSLGNFVFDGFDGAANDTAILLVTIDEGAVIDWELVAARVIDGIPHLVD
jgi:poly-gamma-glutamate synthesis protein (capsule biosynthesis protein)